MMNGTWVLLTAGLAFGITAVSGFGIIPMLRRLKFGQTIREEGPKAHAKKSGTPTMGGVAITPESEVLDIQSRPIPGLYAAGAVTGGVHGFNRLSGNAVADTVVFGRRSGERAAKYALGK